MNSLNIGSHLALELFQEMLRIRRVEEAIAKRYAEQTMRCPVHLSIGQEAVAVGVCKAALHSDYMISNHRAHAHYLAKGGNLKAMIAEIYGKKTGCCAGRGGSMHLIDRSVGMYGSTPIVGGSIPVGVGIAFASQMKNENRATLIFFGEGATEEGVFAESINFASLKKLPVLFVCENNLYSVYSPLHVRQSQHRDRAGIAKAHGMTSLVGYGNDVEEVYRQSCEAIQMIRLGEGPIFLEFATYRYREHCGPNFDNNIGYRTLQEAALWEQQCPLEIQKKRLSLTEVEWTRMEQEIQEEIEEAFRYALKSPFPTFELEQEHPYA